MPTPTYYISRIKLSNIRGFRSLNLSLLDKDQRPRLHTLIIGKNGTGKTTLLRCLAIGLCEPSDGNALVSEDIGQLITEGRNYRLVL